MRKARYTYTVNIELSVRRWFFFWSPVEYVEARVSDVANEEEALVKVEVMLELANRMHLADGVRGSVLAVWQTPLPAKKQSV